MIYCGILLYKVTKYFTGPDGQLVLKELQASEVLSGSLACSEAAASCALDVQFNFEAS
jgi:hypothetical protein